MVRKDHGEKSCSWIPDVDREISLITQQWWWKANIPSDSVLRFLLKKLHKFVYVFLPADVYKHCVCRRPERPEEGALYLELELQVIVHCHVGGGATADHPQEH